MVAHRRVACIAKRDWGSAHVDDASDETDEDREDRVDVSDIIDSGDDTDEEESVIDGRRVNAEKAPWVPDLQPQVSTIVRARLAL